MRFVLPRRFAVVLAVVLSFVLPASVEMASAQTTYPTVRKSVAELSPAEVMSLRKGVAKMMSLDTAGRTTAKFRRSWVYWSNMHGHFGDTCRGPIVGNGMAGLQLWTASNAPERATWCTCQHNTPQFLTWHRMYLYYFEMTLRQASGDPSLTLPYWDEGADGRLPSIFRDTTYVDEAGKTVPNPLRVEARRSSLNAGTAKLAAAVTSPASAMKSTIYSDFSKRLESTPHGSIHCAIADGGCPNGLMGSVPVAAMDPVFYFHHANMDRLYECWLKVDEANRLPTDQAILDQRYSFMSGDGTLKARQVRDMLTTAQLGYSYSEGSGCPAQSTASEPLAATTATTEIAQAAQATLTTTAQAAPMGSMVMSDATELKRGTTELPIVIDQSSTAKAIAPKGKSAAAVTKTTSATLTIEGVNAAVVPGVLYNVYLANDAGKREQVGVINFFGFGGPAPTGKHAHSMGGRTFDFDATEAVQKLGLTASKNPKLIFEPTTGLTDSTPAKATSAIPANAKVTFSSASLRLQP